MCPRREKRERRENYILRRRERREGKGDDVPIRNGGMNDWKLSKRS